MNVDTDTQYAFTRPVAAHMFANYDGVLKVDGEVGNKKAYDPRAWGKAGEAGMAARIVEACENLRSAGTSLGGLTPARPPGSPTCPGNCLIRALPPSSMGAGVQVRACYRSNRLAAGQYAELSGPGRSPGCRRVAVGIGSCVWCSARSFCTRGSSASAK